MKNYRKSGLVYLLFLAGIIVVFLTSCPSPPEDNEGSTTSETLNGSTETLSTVTTEPFSITVELEQTDDTASTNATGVAPQDLLVSITVENPVIPEGSTYDLDFVYLAMTFRGIQTYLKTDPEDPASELISDSNGPIQYHVLEPVEGRIENPGLTGAQDLEFYIVPPENTYVLRYWVEVTINKGEGQTDYAKVPWVTVDEALEMGGNLINPEEE